MRVWGLGRWDKTYKAGIYLTGVGGLLSHNVITDAPHNGILFSGNNHVIEYNRIERVALQSNDVGAIYTGRDWGLRGNIIRYNLLQDINSVFGNFHGIYLDDGGSGITVYGNILHTINGFAILSGGGRDNHMENNVIVAAERGALLTDRRVQAKLNNVFYDSGYPDSWNLLGKLNQISTMLTRSLWMKQMVILP